MVAPKLAAIGSFVSSASCPLAAWSKDDFVPDFDNDYFVPDFDSVAWSMISGPLGSAASLARALILMSVGGLSSPWPEAPPSESWFTTSYCTAFVLRAEVDFLFDAFDIVLGIAFDDGFFATFFYSFASFS